MSEFHYVRTRGPDGGVDAAEGSAVGVDLDTVLDAGLPPFKVALYIASAVAEILAIAAEDDVLHGDLEPQHVFIDDTGAVSVEGFGNTRTQAPEGRPQLETDRHGLGTVLFALLSPHDLPELPTRREAYEDGLIDAILLVNLEGLPDEAIADIQWFLVRLLAHKPTERVGLTDAWQAFGGMAEELQGPHLEGWCEAALDGKGERRDGDQASRPMARPPLRDLDDTTVSGGPLPKGAMNFGELPLSEDKNTGWWTADGLKNALQRALTSDYLEDPDTGWMPGTPIPALDREHGPTTGAWRAKNPEKKPRRAPGEGQRRREMPRNPDSTFGDSGAGDYEDPRLAMQLGVGEDAMTVAGNLGVPLNQHTPAPTPPRRSTPKKKKPVQKASAPKPQPSRPTRKPKAPAADPDTKPQFVSARGVPTDNLQSLAPVAVSSKHAPAPRPPTPAPAETRPITAASPAADQKTHAQNQTNAPGPVPMPDLSRGPNPFENVEEEVEGPNVPLLATIGVVVVMASFLCVGTVGLGSVTAFLGFNEGTESPGPKAGPNPADPDPAPEEDPDPTPVPKPSLKAAPKPLPAPQNFAAAKPRPAPFPKPTRPRPAAPLPSPVRPTPSPARPQPVRPQPVRPQPVRPQPVRPAPEPVRPAPFPTPAPAPFPAPAPAPFPTPAPAPLSPDGSILPSLVPTPLPGPNGERPSELQVSMTAHFATATAARDAVILGDPEAARVEAEKLEFLQTPASLPPNWQPYVVDLKVEAWLMGNSSDLGAAGFKVAQIGAACASCHAGVHAGPTVNPAAVPSRSFPHKDVMRKHSWAVDWMWVGLIANDDAAWARGAKELAESPFASAVLEGFPEPEFVALEDKLHALAVESQTATGQDRAAVYGSLLATCATCHVTYRPKEP